MILVSLYDAKAETWSNPHACANKATALREFQSLVWDGGKTLVSQHPADFDLFEVATCNDLFDGKLVPCSAPIHLANGNDFIKLKQPSMPSEEVNC